MTTLHMMFEFEPTSPKSFPLDPNLVNQEIEDEDQLRHMFEESLIMTRLSGPQEPSSDQSTSWPSPKMDKRLGQNAGI